MRYGWIPQDKDSRDLYYGVTKPDIKLPSKIDLRDKMPPIWDQGQLGSCTAHGIGRCIAYAENKTGISKGVMPSRLFLYYNERDYEGTVNEDAGAIIRDGIKVCNRVGYCDESDWTYDIAKFTQRPPAKAYQDAQKNRIHYYAAIKVDSIDNLKIAMVHGYPVVFGFQVYRDFENYKRGQILKKPRLFEQSLGGHCVATAGYDDDKQAVLVANSWGSAWGEDGYFWMSYAYITSYLCSDFWVIRLKEYG